MKPGAGDEEYQSVFTEQVLPRLDTFEPAFVLISAGFDAAGSDQTAHINLEPASFGWMTASISAVADRCCSGRVVSVLEGGYDLVTLGRCVLAHLDPWIHA
jgi:acetoin utilization deacetylase AcuC-like enzyme